MISKAGGRLVWLASLLTTTSFSQTTTPTIDTAVRQVVGLSAETGDRFVTADGLRVALSDFQAPEASAEVSAPYRGSLAARESLQRRIQGVTLTLDATWVDASGVVVARVLDPEKRSLAESLVREGLGRPLWVEATSDAQPLRSALSSARERGLGVHAAVRAQRPVPNMPADQILGVALGLYSKVSDFDYGPLLDQIRLVGASHVLLVVPRFSTDHRATEIHPVPGRTAPFRTVIRTTRQAHERGLSVAYMPILLLENESNDHWRGTLAPRSLDEWFRNYARLLGVWSDVAEECGADILVIGSEFSSLESERDRWRGVIRTARARFSGRLTYSSNWDHYSAVGFWGELDFVGMTAYHELTDTNDPSGPALREAWARLRDRLLRFQSTVGKPLLITELGYASLDGTNRAPWNYTARGRADPDEQAACFEAALQTWSQAPSEAFAGQFVYDWWQDRGPTDRTNYSLRGKPAEHVLRQHFGARRRDARSR